MAMKSLPTASLKVIQATFLLGIFIKLLDHPARMSQQDQALQGSLLWQHAEPVLDLLFLDLLRLNRGGLRVISHGFWHRAFGQQPAFRPGVHARVSGAVQGGAGGPMHTQSDRLDPHRAFGALAPAESLPGRGGQGLDHLLYRVQRGRTRLTWLPTSLVDGWLGGGRLHLVGQTAAEGALYSTDVGNLALIESSRDALGLSP